MNIPPSPEPATLDDLQAAVRAAAMDGQPRGAVDVRAWATAAAAERWTRAELAAAVIGVIATFTGFKILPGHVIEQVRANRDRIRARWYCPDPPRALADDPRAEIAWRRRAADSFRDRANTALATGQPLDDVPLLAGPVEADPPAAVERRSALAEITAAIGDAHAVAKLDHHRVGEAEFEQRRDEQRQRLARVWAAVDACPRCDVTGQRPDGSTCTHRASPVPETATG